MIRESPDSRLVIEVVNMRTTEIVLSIPCDDRAEAVNVKKSLEFAFVEAVRVALCGCDKCAGTAMHLADHVHRTLGYGYDERGPWWIHKHELVSEFGEEVGEKIAAWLREKKRYTVAGI